MPKKKGPKRIDSIKEENRPNRGELYRVFAKLEMGVYYRCRQGIDYTGSIRKFVYSLRHFAKTRGFHVATRMEDDTTINFILRKLDDDSRRQEDKETTRS